MEPEKKLNTILVINALFQLTNDIGKKTKDKYRQRIGIWGIYMTRYMTRTNLRHLFKNKGNFIYNYKLKRFEHMSETPVWGSFYHMQSIKKEIFKHELK